MKRKDKIVRAIQFQIALLIILGALIQGASCIQLTASGGGCGDSGSVAMNIEAADTTAVNSRATINGAEITPTTAMSGPIPLFEQTHAVTDTTGKKAQVYVKVVNAPNGLTYASQVLPKEGTVNAQSFLSAEQWLAVPKADSIKCTASASYRIRSYGTRSYRTRSYGTGSADIGLEESKGSTVGDYVTLNGYYGKAYASPESVSASQTATDGEANSIKIYSHANDGNKPFSVDTTITGISGAKASFTGLNSVSSSGNTQVTQEEHVLGSFTSAAKADTVTITRTSNYGDEYDLDMRAAKGPSVSGTLGYYISPTKSANKIQGAISAAQPGDIINVAAGTYNENIKIDKSLTINGAGSGKTIVDGQQAGTVANVNSGNVVFNGMTFKNGKAVYGAGIAVNSNRVVLTLNDVSITGNTATDHAGGIYNYGTVNFNSGSIDHNYANKVGGGVHNNGIFNINGGSISNNNAYYGAGIYSWKTVNMKGGSISSNTGYQGTGIYVDGTLNMYGGSIDHNIADGKAGGLYIDGAGIATIYDGSISYNTANIGGGVYNDGVVTLKGGSVANNKAGYGGGMYNYGTANLAGGSINQNTATIKGGGGIYTDAGSKSVINVDGSLISSNIAPYGGGIYISGGPVNLISGSISSNTATQNGGGICNIRGTITGNTGIVNNNNPNQIVSNT